jgi:enoyl-CoA hydratase/carnithine racemase
MIRVEYKDGGRADICLERPERHNALSLAMLDALRHVCTELTARMDIQVVVLRADGPTFCAGGDLTEVVTMLHPGGGANLQHCGTAALAAFSALPMPTVVSLWGPAIGGGAELALAADFRIAGPLGAFEFRHLRLGVTPAWGSVKHLLSTVGLQAARRMLLRGERFDAQALELCGLATLAADAVDEAAAIDAFLVPLRRQEPAALRRMKHLLHVYANQPSVDQVEADAFIESWGSAGHLTRTLDALKRTDPKR